MDEMVRQAMAKWPNVPACYGWLGLDARGQWYMRDERTQAAGEFASGRPGAKGSLLLHEKLIDFIGRNYLADALGRWYFQNGPQQVFVELELTPWIWRLQPDGQVLSHTGAVAEARSCLLDEQGRVFLDADLGLGLVHSQDVLLAAQLIEDRQWQLENLSSQEMPQRFGYVCSPQREAQLQAQAQRG